MALDRLALAAAYSICTLSVLLYRKSALLLPSTPQALAHLAETWGRVCFVFTPHGGSAGEAVCTVKMEEADFEALEDNQVLVQVGGALEEGSYDCNLIEGRAGGWKLGLLLPWQLELLAACRAGGLPAPQGMLANRFMATFREDITGWNRKLNAVADVVQLLAEIQRSWACELSAGFACALAGPGCVQRGLSRD